MPFDVDIVIVIIFLILTLVIGLGHGQKVKSIQDYALGGRNFSTGALVATTVATWVGGGFFFTVISKIYSDGLFFLIALIGMTISLLTAAYIFIPRIGIFLGSTSVAEAMGNLYGRHVRIITAITGNIAYIGLISVQFKVFGNIFSYLFNLPGSIAIIVAGTVVTLYSAFGGIRSVTFTDILQFVTFGFMIPMIAIVIWDKCCVVDGQSFFDTMSQTAKFNYKEALNPNNIEFWQMIPLLLYFMIPGGGMEPAIFQRIAMGSNLQQIKKVFIISAVLLFFIVMITAWIPFLIFNTNPNLMPDQLLGFIIDNYVFTGLKGFILIGIISMAMSTADSAINSSSILFANDIYNFVKLNKKIYIVKIFAVALGVFSILLALFSQDLLTIILTASGFYIPVVTIPLLISTLGFRTSSKSVLISMAAGFITISVWQISNISFNGIVVAMCVNLLSLLASHYLLKQKGGWINKNNEYILEKHRNKKNIRAWFQKFNALALYKKHLPKNEFSYVGFGIYCIIYTLTTMYSINIHSNENGEKIILVIYQVMMITGVVIAIYPIWPITIKKETRESIAKAWWGISVFYMLIFFNCFFVMINGSSGLPFALFTINIVLAVLLLGYKLSLLLIPAGFYFAVQFYKYYSNIEKLDISIGSPQFIFMYILILIGAILLIFLKPKQEYQEATEEKVGTLTTEVDVLDHKVSHLDQKVDHLEFHAEVRKKELSKAFELKYEFLRNLQHEAHTPITGITSMGEALYECYDKLTDEQRKSYLKDIAQSSTRLNSYVNNMIDLSKLSSMNYKFKRESIDFTKLVKERAEICKKLYSDDKSQGKQEFILDLEDNVSGYFDKYYISQVIDNIIINAIQYSKEGKITIRLSQTKGIIKFSVSDEGIGIPKEDLHNIFGAFTVSSKTKTPAGGRGVGLAVCKKIIELNNGVISAQQNKRKGVTFTFTLPKK